MSQLKLRHITLWGPNVPLASVEFGPGLTLIRGPSDTGKSFIVNAIDFMLGAGSLKEIPERDGYSTVLLGLELPSNEIVTLTRSTSGGPFSLYLSDVRSGPLEVPDENLAARHNPQSDSSVSKYLLRQLDLDSARVRRNAQGATDSLSFRNLAHLCVVDETQMQAETPPALTGQYVTRTKEVSTLKLLLEAEDDSNLVPAQGTQDRARVTTAKVEVIDQLLSEIQVKLEEAPEESELRDQLARLNASIEKHTSAVGGLLASRAEIVEQTRSQQVAVQEARTELAEVRALQSRFGLLSRQYDSDLDRLETIREAGVLLGFFTPGKCPFCGAEVEDQHFNREHGAEGDAFEDSIDAETRKTRALRADLELTLQELARRREEVRSSGQQMVKLIDKLGDDLRKLDEQLLPERSGLKQLIDVKSDLEKFLALYARADELSRLKAGIADDSRADSAAVIEGMNLSALAEFSTELAARLAAWGFPDASTVRYDRSEQDIQAGDQYRSAHGKGVRALLHAAFTLGLAQYCFNREAPHPGFVVLDSPLVTYRPPDQSSALRLDDSLPPDVITAFYRDVQSRFDGQVIIMENLDPTESLDPGTVDVVFTKVDEVGRYGFIPHRSPGAGTTRTTE